MSQTQSTIFCCQAIEQTQSWSGRLSSVPSLELELFLSKGQYRPVVAAPPALAITTHNLARIVEVSMYDANVHGPLKEPYAINDNQWAQSFFSLIYSITPMSYCKLDNEAVKQVIGDGTLVLPDLRADIKCPQHQNLVFVCRAWIFACDIEASGCESIVRQPNSDKEPASTQPNVGTPVGQSSAQNIKQSEGQPTKKKVGAAKVKSNWLKFDLSKDTPANNQLWCSKEAKLKPMNDFELDDNVNPTMKNYASCRHCRGLE